MTVEFTVLFPIENITVVSLTFAPTFAPKLKLPVVVENTEELTCVFTELLPICKATVVRLTFAPTLAPDVKLPALIEINVLLTTADPIFKSNGERFAVEELFDILSRIEFAKAFAVLLPI